MEKGNFSIVFKELDRLLKEPDMQFLTDEFREYEEIRTLRKIVSETQEPVQVFLTTT